MFFMCYIPGINWSCFSLALRLVTKGSRASPWVNHLLDSERTSVRKPIEIQPLALYPTTPMFESSRIYLAFYDDPDLPQTPSALQTPLSRTPVLGP